MIGPPRGARSGRNPPGDGGSGGWPGSCSSGGTVSRPRTPPSILVLAPPGEETDELFADLSRREDVCLLRVATPAAASVAVREVPVALFIAGPDLPAAALDAVMVQLDAIRPHTPVLAIRARRAEEPAAWAARSVGVLRLPLLPGVLSRSVDVVLGMKRPHEKGN
jgi:hypothetical protein